MIRFFEKEKEFTHLNKKFTQKTFHSPIEIEMIEFFFEWEGREKTTFSFETESNYFMGESETLILASVHFFPLIIFVDHEYSEKIVIYDYSQRKIINNYFFSNSDIRIVIFEDKLLTFDKEYYSYEFASDFYCYPLENILLSFSLEEDNKTLFFEEWGPPLFKVFFYHHMTNIRIYSHYILGECAHTKKEIIVFNTEETRNKLLTSDIIMKMLDEEKKKILFVVESLTKNHSLIFSLLRVALSFFLSKEKSEILFDSVCDNYEKKNIKTKESFSPQLKNIPLPILIMREVVLEETYRIGRYLHTKKIDYFTE